jgi:hypothetical protein
VARRRETNGTFYDAVPIPSKRMGKADVLRLLRNRFPEFAELFCDPENIDPEVDEPYYSYSRLVEQVLARKEDNSLLKRVSSFVNEMTTSKDPWLEELVGVEVLEGLAQDPIVAASLYASIVPEAQASLKAIERRMYGRE